ncbi:GNAT family N-acetyltransferase [Streptomyces sp. Ru87]|nr:GNAT family N-acetyltransferase [Streptomyces sp. Ru87]PGH50513.1 GNAT family N-acetyltransferase [Streptomyces sp. Ru87]
MGIRTEVVPVAEIFDLRWAVLRAGMPRESAVFAEDSGPEVFHIAAYDGDAPGRARVLGCVTFFPDPLPPRAAAAAASGAVRRGAADGGARGGGPGTAYRFRGMASAPGVRGEGYGAAVLRAGLAEAAARGASAVWCNGRSPARGFYEHHGFTAVGEEFVIETAGPHYVFVARL